MSLSLVKRPGVYLVAVQDEGVLFDLGTNRYFGLTAVSTAIWEALAPERTAREIAESIVDDELEADEAEQLVKEQIEVWREAGLVVPPAARAAEDLPTARTARADRAIERSDLDRTPVSARAVVSILGSMWWVRRVLGKRPISTLLREVQSIDARRPAPRDVILATVRAYELVRRPFHVGDEDCLPRSLALARALRLRGVDAAVCFGVRKFPFSGHAWVEADGQILNNRSDFIAAFERVAAF